MLEPFSITWTIIPGMTSKVSFIGHLAITDSTGMQYDFGADFCVNIN